MTAPRMTTAIRRKMAVIYPAQSCEINRELLGEHREDSRWGTSMPGLLKSLHAPHFIRSVWLIAPLCRLSRRLGVCVVAGLVAPAGALGIPVAFADDSTIAIVAALSGQARIERVDTRQQMPVEASTGLRRGDRLMTGDGSTVSLLFGDGSRLVLGADSTITFGDYVAVQGRRAGALLMELGQGIMRWTGVKAAGARDKRVEVRTAAGTVAIDGGDVVSSLDAGRLSTLLLQGRASVRNREGTSALSRPRSGIEGVEAKAAPGQAYGWHRTRIDTVLMGLGGP